MELQRILFPQAGKCTEEELYFHIEGNLKLTAEESQSLLLEKEDKILFDTYFNAFSIEKWKKYTVVDNVYLKIKLSGKMGVRLISKEIVDGKLNETVIAEKTVEADTSRTFEFDFASGSGKGIYTFEIIGLSDESRFYGGAYCSRCLSEEVHKVNIGICICTYKREEFIEKNLRTLNEEILSNEESPVYGHLEVFIADNGKTLDINKFQSQKIHILPNRNLGGAGGFTRDIIEIYNNNSKLGITHALLMDDDIMIETDAIVRTYKILSLLKEEYMDVFIGGAMLRLDRPYMQVESGAQWNVGAIKSLKSNMDMRICENCICNEQEEPAEYNAWWYCCFPMRIVKENNLPLPMFIRFDDVEYGLRNMKKLILMNGICVWHEPFENKYSSFLEYYMARNQLINNAFHYPQEYDIRYIARDIFSRCLQEIMFYRYKNVELFLWGVKDFLKGPEWLSILDGEENHYKVMALGYKAQPISELKERFNIEFNQKDYENSCNIVDSKSKKIKRYLTFNGLFLPTVGENCIPMSQAKTIQCYRKKRVLHYDENNHTGFVTEKSIRLSLKYIFQMLLVMFQVVCKYKNVQEQYRTKGMRLRTLECWKNNLKL